MIFTAIGLLVVALAFLVAGIAKSSVALLVLSVVATVAAGAFLWVSFAFYRKAALAASGGEPSARTGWPAAYVGPGATPVPAAAPAPAPPVAAPAAPAGNGNGRHAPASAPPLDGWDDLTATDLAALVDTLNLDELHEVRRYEVEHAARKTVLRAVDRRIDSIVTVRRQVKSSR